MEMERPKQLKEVNLDELKQTLESYIDFLDDDDLYIEDDLGDYMVYIAEAALKAFYVESVSEYTLNRRN